MATLHNSIQQTLRLKTNPKMTILQEFYQVTFRKKLYDNIDELQKDLDERLNYNNERTHQGQMCGRRTPMQTLTDGKQLWMEKFIN